MFNNMIWRVPVQVGATPVAVELSNHNGLDIAEISGLRQIEQMRVSALERFVALGGYAAMGAAGMSQAKAQAVTEPLPAIFSARAACQR